MKSRIFLLGLLCVSLAGTLQAQEADSGVELAATVSGEGLYSRQLSTTPGDTSPEAAALKAVVYPTWKFSQHWSTSGAVAVYTHPYYFQDLTSDKYDAEVQILNAQLTYSRFWGNRSLVVRAGQLSTAFGSFSLRYDDAVNPLIDVPMSYGYYRGVTLESLAGVEVDTTLGKLDLRGQLANSSPANPRSLLDNDQYGNWAWGGGYTIRQGFRIGASAYRGPYLDRHYPYFFPGEALPQDLPGNGAGVDVQWGSGHWNVNAEWQRFQMDYRAIPTFISQTGYSEVRFVLSPRWYVATRLGYMHPNAIPGWQSYEFGAGYRPGRRELVKAEYEVQQGPNIHGAQKNTLAIQFVTTIGPYSFGDR